MAVFTFRKFPSPKLLLLFFGHFCSRRRAMVNKLWCRELARKWFHVKFESPHPRCFSEAKCQDRVHPWYLTYRWLIFTLWTIIIICSILEIGSAKPLCTWEKWPIYLTNWDLILGVVQSFLGAILVTRRWKWERNPDFDASRLEYGKLERIYWYLYVVTSSLAIGVTVIYWGFVHDPNVHQVDPLNLLIHVSNTVLMLIDFCVVSVPFKLRCFWWCPLLASFYLLFTLVYYLAGGLDKHGKHQIYNILDWERPGRSLIVCAGGLTFLVIIHCLLYFLARIKDRAYLHRWNITSSPLKDPSSIKQDALHRKIDSCV